ncbi:hypothetical protein ACFQ08_00580 [Streptosporangium algeriense]|uniref:Uncharacterized protein n=1 Tax=Streptosporangium algeriense TaxID=1682748 RepID=A0ABW3DIP4_9ACTN
MALWAAALLTAVAPSAWFWIMETLSSWSGGSYSSLVAIRLICSGYKLDNAAQALLHPIQDLPFMEYGAAPLIALSWGGALLAGRIGRPRLGRILPYLTVALLVVCNLPSPLLFILDMSRDPACTEIWGPPEITGWNTAMRLYALVPAVLILLALRTPGTRRGRLTRVGATLLLATPTLLFATADTATGRANDPQELGCTEDAEQDSRFPREILEGHYGEGAPGPADTPDHELLAYNDRLCEPPVQNRDDVDSSTMEKATPGQ